jgi:hypothetical protein
VYVVRGDTTFRAKRFFYHHHAGRVIGVGIGSHFPFNKTPFAARQALNRPIDQTPLFGYNKTPFYRRPR